jgi:hypothetical protein
VAEDTSQYNKGWSFSILLHNTGGETMSHHHHHHGHSHSSSSSPATSNPIGGLDFSSALKNINFPSLASSLIGSMDIGQLFGVLTSMTSSPLKNTVSPQQSASTIMKKDTSQSSAAAAEKKDISVEEEDDSEDSEPKAAPDTQAASDEAGSSENPYQNMKFDPEKLSGMLNNLVNMLNSQPKP